MSKWRAGMQQIASQWRHSSKGPPPHGLFPPLSVHKATMVKEWNSFLLSWHRITQFNCLLMWHCGFRTRSYNLSYVFIKCLITLYFREKAMMYCRVFNCVPTKCDTQSVTIITIVLQPSHCENCRSQTPLQRLTLALKRGLVWIEFDRMGFVPQKEKCFCNVAQGYWKHTRVFLNHRWRPPSSPTPERRSELWLTFLRVTVTGLDIIFK